MAETDLSNTIATNAAGPARVTTDDLSVDQQRLADQIEADKHLANKAAAAASPTFGLRFAKLNPPGAQ